MVHTQQYFCLPFLPIMSEGLVSCSGCRQAGTRFRHQDTRAQQRTRALGSRRPFGLQHLRSNLSEQEEKETFESLHSLVKMVNGVIAETNLL